MTARETFPPSPSSVSRCRPDISTRTRRAVFFPRLLDRLIRCGTLTFIDPQGHSRIFAGPSIDGIAPVTIRLRDVSLDWHLALRPAMAVGEAYMDGDLTVEQGSLYDFLGMAAYNLCRPHCPPGQRLASRAATLLRRLYQWNPVTRATQNARHHYDLAVDFYDLFLDADRQYSCAYYAHSGMTLEEAQEAKKRHIAAKLLLAPGQRVLDIGCGWGGLALALAAAAGVEVLGITLSREQLDEARRRAALNGLADRVRFELCDYRNVKGVFDRIVSVGMFEHVGIGHYREFFAALREHLADGGVALLHSIGSGDGPGATNPWIRKYIFPGGHMPALSEVLPAVEHSGLQVTDIEILREHYADTLREWRHRFQVNRDEVARLYDERFCRMWEFYLAGSEAAFRHQGLMVFQMQMAKGNAGIPATRDYMTASSAKDTRCDRPPDESADRSG